MSNKISIELADLERQGQELAGLADRMDAHVKSFSENSDRLYDSLQGFLNFHITLKTIISKVHLSILVDYLRYGSDIAQKCVNAYKEADSDIASKINMNNEIINTGFPGSDKDSQEGTYIKGYEESNQTIYSPTKKITGPDGRTYNVVGNYDESCNIKQGDSAFDNPSNACAATSIEIVRRLNGKSDGDGWVDYLKKEKIAKADGSIIRGGYGTAGIEPVPGSTEAFGDDRRKMIYEQLAQGNAVIGNVKPGANRSHFVVFVGTVDGADPNNLKDSDFIIMDPANGKTRVLTSDKGYSLDGFETNSYYGLTDKRPLRVWKGNQ